MSNFVHPHRRQPTRLPRPWDPPGKNTGVGCHFLLQCLKVKSESEVAQSCSTLCDPKASPGQNTGGGSLSLLQGIFPTQGLNPSFPHFRQILYLLSHQGSPRKLEWVDYPFFRRSSQPRNWNLVSCIAGRFFTVWVTREARKKAWYLHNLYTYAYIF